MPRGSPRSSIWRGACRRWARRSRARAPSEITIEGVDRLHGATHPVVIDRIELGTYMLAPAIAGGEVELLGGRIDLIGAFVEKLRETGVSVTETEAGLKVERASGRVRAVDVVTEPFPGFPTDLQAQMMALLCTAEGSACWRSGFSRTGSCMRPELIRMGARIDVHGGTATVTGVERLKGAPVMATDLRASVSLILAGLAAEGDTVVSRVYHLDRGYERVEEKLSAWARRSNGCQTMTEDARFEDADEAPMALRALDEGDLKVLAALVQDAVSRVRDEWDRKRRRFAVLLNRFRWEEAGRRPPERVRALLVIEDALKVASQGITRDDPDLVLSLLTLTGRRQRTARGRITLILAGDGAVAVDVEALEVTLKDVTHALCRDLRQGRPIIPTDGV
jgi:hypothetical protein